MESGTKKMEMLFVLNKVSLLFYSYGRSGVRMSLFFYSSGGISDKVLFRGGDRIDMLRENNHLGWIQLQRGNTLNRSTLCIF